MHNKQIAVIAGPSSPVIGHNIAKELDLELLAVNVRTFVDGECKIQMPNVNGKYCILVQSLYPPADSHLLQLLMMIKKCTDDGAADICAVVPYMAYARQDRAFVEGDVITSALVAKLLEAVGTNRLVTLDIHSQLALSYFSIRVENASSIPILADYVKRNMDLDRPVIVSPDLGGVGRAEEFARLLNVEVTAMEKYRDRNTGHIFIDEKKLDTVVCGRDIIIVDDIISTGASIIKAAEILKKNKSKRIYAMCSHSLFDIKNKQRIKDAGVEEIIATNSIPSEFSKIDISPPLSRYIQNIIYE